MAGRIYADAVAARLKPNETCRLRVGFHNMPPCALRYEVDPRDGTVSEDGVYTASDKQGVHVIRVLCADNPIINTFAYADVRR